VLAGVLGPARAPVALETCERVIAGPFQRPAQRISIKASRAAASSRSGGFTPSRSAMQARRLAPGAGNTAFIGVPHGSVTPAPPPKLNNKKPLQLRAAFPPPAVAPMTWQTSRSRRFGCLT